MLAPGLALKAASSLRVTFVECYHSGSQPVPSVALAAWYPVLLQKPHGMVSSIAVGSPLHGVERCRGSKPSLGTDCFCFGFWSLTHNQTQYWACCCQCALGSWKAALELLEDWVTDIFG
jgi:hypothetical protein